MALPKITHPMIEIKIPSLNKIVNFRPFLVKEEKVLLMVKEENSESGIATAIKEIVKNCCLDETININKLTLVDIEYCFLKIRARSVDNMVNLQYKDLDDEKIYEFDVDLDKIDIYVDETLDKKIMINDSIGLIMKYFLVEDLDKFIEHKSIDDLTSDIIRLSIAQVFDDSNVYEFSESTIEEQFEFLNNLDIKVYEKIKDFLSKTPKLKHTLEYTNSLGNTKTIVLDKLTDFFILR